MAVIQQDEYRDIAVTFANARSNQLSAKDFIFDAVYVIVLLQSIQPEVDLLSTFWDTYQINSDTLQAPTLMLSAVRELNQHVLFEGGYEDIDSYLEENGTLVPQEWADLSDAAGFTISDSNIE